MGLASLQGHGGQNGLFLNKEEFQELPIGWALREEP